MTTPADVAAGWAEPHPALARGVESLGDEARRWLEGLPLALAETVATWGLEVEGPLPVQGETSRTLAVRTAGGRDAVLKALMPHDEARGEAPALAVWDGEGAVRLLRRSDDGMILLLERCRPGDELWSVPRLDRLDITASVLARLWSASAIGARGGVAVVPPLSDTARRWACEVAAHAAWHGFGSDLAGMLEDVVPGWTDELLATAPDPVLLHGDLHPGNVLRSGAAWVAIDPKPWVGDPAFDLAQLLFNELDPPDRAVGDGRAGTGGGGAARSVDDLVGWAERLCGALDLDPLRVLRWAVVKAAGWGTAPAAAELLVRAARDLERSDR